MKKAARDSSPNEKTQSAPTPRVAFKPPLKPRPGLFYAMLGLFGVWVGILLTLYFVTVYPNRHHRVEPLEQSRKSESLSR